MNLNKTKKIIAGYILGFVMVLVSACGNIKNNLAEKIELGETVLNEVEFSNSDKVEINKQNNEYEITGEIEALSKAQVSAFGMEDVTHAVVVKIVFDKERTIDSFKIKGNVTKVYSTDNTEQNYVGTLSSVLDNEEGEDAYCYLILSANTKEYVFTVKYSDSTESVIKIKIDARLVTAVSE